MCVISVVSALSLQVWVECGGVMLGPVSVFVMRVCIVCFLYMCVCVFVWLFVYECYVCMIIVVPAISAGYVGVWRSEPWSY